MKDQQHNNEEIFQHNMFKQMENLPVIIGKYDQLEKQQDIGVDDIREFVQEIEAVLIRTGQELARQQEVGRNTGA